MGKKNIIKYVDLCCGIGGFRLGINEFQKTHSNYKFKCVYAIDIKKDAVDCYNLNFNENLVPNDIFDIDINELPDFDLLCCGFPCQSFSSAGNKHGFNDKRGQVIFKLIEICSIKQPQTIILENVPNIITMLNGSIIKKIIEEFELLNYHLSYKILNSKDFGVPQFRERIYIIGSLNKKIKFKNIKYFDNNVYLNTCIENVEYTDINLRFAIKLLKLHEKSGIYGYKIQDKRGGDKNIHSWDLSYFGKINNKSKELMNQILLERRKKHWSEEKNIIWTDGMPLTFNDIKTFNSDKHLQKMLDNLVELGYLKLEHYKKVINGKKQYIKNSEVGYNICRGKLSFPITKILDPNNICPTLTATDSMKLGIIINNNHIRKLTMKELAQISGFPITFIIPSYVNIYDLFGNTVIPSVINAILDIIF